MTVAELIAKMQLECELNDTTPEETEVVLDLGCEYANIDYVDKGMDMYGAGLVVVVLR